MNIGTTLVGLAIVCFAIYVFVGINRGWIK